MTIIEAMGTGLPIAASRVGGVPDMLRDGESGLLMDCDPGEVCAACERLIDSEDLRRTLGRTRWRTAPVFLRRLWQNGIVKNTPA